MYKFKDITPVLAASDMIDVVLSKTQRKTPTEVHPQFKITRIRNFYMRKVKFAQSTFEDKFNGILDQFPKIDDLHPFYADLCNVLYDRDHYKLALGQVKTVAGTIESICKDYLKLLKFADSLYKCKMLKKAALGRMCTAVKKLGPTTQYLEEVRQHLARLPQINPSTRTLIVTGYPNVGKSSFMNLVTDANVEVQPYAFTTKSVYVGHMDYKYSRWQVLDTPGILDHPLEQRNTIEMTAITALAHIHAAILFFIDVSEQCGFSLEQQVALFHSIKPLFKNKPLLVVMNKIDSRPLDTLSETHKSLIQTMRIDDKVSFVATSCLAQAGIDLAKNTACELLLAERLEKKIQQNKLEAVKHRMFIVGKAAPSSRPAMVPSGVSFAKEDEMDTDTSFVGESSLTERDLEELHGGAGVFSADWRKRWELANASWRYDKLPEVLDGHNIQDFIDPEIDAKIAALEAEEQALMWADVNDEAEAAEWREAQKVLGQIHSKIEQKRVENREKKTKGRDAIVRAKNRKTPTQVEDYLESIGVAVAEHGAIKQHAKLIKRGATRDEEMEEVPDRIDQGLPRVQDKVLAEIKKRKDQKMLNKHGRSGESDRFISVKKPRHLFSGKRTNGTNDWR